MQQADPTAGLTGQLLPIRPLGVTEVIDGAFRTLRATFALVAVIVVAVTGPFQLIQSLVLTRLLGGLPDPLFADPVAVEPADLDLLVGLATWGGLLSIVGLVIGVVVSAAVVEAALERDRGRQPTLSSVLRTSVQRLGATLGASVLTVLLGMAAGLALIVVVGPMLVLVPPLGVIVLLPTAGILGLLLLAISSLVIPVAMVERQGAWTTFTRTLWVVRNRFWRVLGVTLIAGLVVGLVTLALNIAFSLLLFVAGPFDWVLDAVSGTIVSVIATPVSAFVALLIYLDVRVRLEGFDLLVRARGMDSW